MSKYKEIKKLYDFCMENGVNCIFEPLMDGSAICFAKGDVVQHCGSYGNGCGMVEFGFTGYEEVDFVATSLTDAKKFILKHKDELSMGNELLEVENG